MAVKRIVAPRQAPVMALAAPTGKATAALHESLPPKTIVVEAEQRQNPWPRFACGADVEVRSRFPQVPGKRQLVIYARAKVVSASAGTDSYLVQYPAASSIPSRTARVPAWDVRAARPVPAPPESAVDGAARPASSKRPSPSDRSERGADDGCKKVKIRTGKGIPMNALRRFFAEHAKEEEAKRKKEQDAEFLARKRIKMVDRGRPVFALFSRRSFRCLRS